MMASERVNNVDSILAHRITLAEVFARWDKCVDATCNHNPEAGELLEEAADGALQYIMQNRPALERFELERAAREACGVDEWTPVRLFASNDEPERMLVYYGGTDCQVVEIVEVGRGWTPEVGK